VALPVTLTLRSTPLYLLKRLNISSYHFKIKVSDVN
jgi:hypothetical protein